MPYVSVIVPCYNTASYIERCMQGFEKQSYHDFEVIFVDDCSTDDTARVIQDYITKSNIQMRYIKNDQNMGPSKTRKHGIEASEATYIAFCDSDDWYEPDYLQKMVAQADKNDADMVFCGYQTISIKRGKEKRTKHLLGTESSELNTKEALRLSVDSLWVLLVRREIVQEISFPDLRNGEDMAIIPLMIAMSSSYGVVDEGLYNYLYRENSASMTANEKVVEALRRSFEHIENNMSKEYKEECETIGVRNLLYGGLLALFKYSYDKKKAKEILVNFEKKYPEWMKNEQMIYLPFYKKVFLKLAGRRCFFGLKVLSMIHLIMTRN